ncbi:MAG: sensor histidine kinase, partial [Nevskiales bacterium]
VHNARLRQAETYRRILIAYAVVLLLGLAYLGWRLRKSFIDLVKANRQLARSNETLEVKVQERTQDLTKAYAALKSTQAQVVQSEKMASLGQMVAGVAHEINTPLGFVRSNVDMVGGMFQDIKRLLERYAHTVGLIRAPNADDNQITQAFDQLAVAEAEVDTIVLDEAGTLLTDSIRGLNQINDLVSNLKDFSRLDRSRMDWFDVNEGLNGTLTISRNQIKDRVEVVKNYGQVPQIQCAPSQVNQIFLNLITNATQAIGSGGGQIRLTTRATGGEVQIVFEDTGCGMTPEIMSKIYEPFFTTKEIGKGTGLGLSIVYQIIEEHHGRIEVHSEPGKGSRFTVTLPIQQQAEAA